MYDIHVPCMTLFVGVVHHRLMYDITTVFLCHHPIVHDIIFLCINRRILYGVLQDHLVYAITILCMSSFYGVWHRRLIYDSFLVYDIT